MLFMQCMTCVYCHHRQSVSQSLYRHDADAKRLQSIIAGESKTPNAQFYREQTFAIHFRAVLAAFAIMIRGPINRISHGSLTIMTKLWLTYDGRLIYQPSYEERRLFLGTIYLLNRKTVGDSIRKRRTIFLREILARRKSLSLVDLTINLRWDIW